jgi:hypothetical protein
MNGRILIACGFSITAMAVDVRGFTCANRRLVRAFLVNF